MNIHVVKEMEFVQSNNDRMSSSYSMLMPWLMGRSLTVVESEDVLGPEVWIVAKRRDVGGIGVEVMVSLHDWALERIGGHRLHRDQMGRRMELREG